MPKSHKVKKNARPEGGIIPRLRPPVSGLTPGGIEDHVLLRSQTSTIQIRVMETMKPLVWAPACAGATGGGMG